MSDYLEAQVEYLNSLRTGRALAMRMTRRFLAIAMHGPSEIADEQLA